MGAGMTRRIVIAIVALLLGASSAAAPPDAPPANKAGNISALLPLANVVRGPAKQEVITAAKKGDDVIWNDLVRTDKGGRARITLLDQSILSVGSQAELRIIKHDAKSQQTSIEVGYGRVRMEVTPVTKQGGSFEVKTVHRGRRRDRDRLRHRLRHRRHHLPVPLGNGDGGQQRSWRSRPGALHSRHGGRGSCRQSAGHAPGHAAGDPAVRAGHRARCHQRH